MVKVILFTLRGGEVEVPGSKQIEGVTESRLQAENMEIFEKENSSPYWLASSPLAALVRCPLLRWLSSPVSVNTHKNRF